VRNIFGTFSIALVSFFLCFLTIFRLRFSVVSFEVRFDSN
jgi:hypothetical protein